MRIFIFTALLLASSGACAQLLTPYDSAIADARAKIEEINRESIARQNAITARINVAPYNPSFAGAEFADSTPISTLQNQNYSLIRLATLLEQKAAFLEGLAAKCPAGSMPEILWLRQQLANNEQTISQLQSQLDKLQLAKNLGKEKASGK